MIELVPRQKLPTKRALFRDAEQLITRSMAEVALTGEDHGEAALISSSDDLVVTHRSARLDDARHTGFSRCIKSVTKGKEGIARARATRCSPFGSPGGNSCGVETILLSSTNPESLLVLRVDDCVAGDRSAHNPGELHICPLPLGRLH
jgi:hypothetical protein